MTGFGYFRYISISVHVPKPVHLRAAAVCGYNLCIRSTVMLRSWLTGHPPLVHPQSSHSGIMTLYIPYSYWGLTIYILCGGYGRACGHASSCVAALTREWSVLLQFLSVVAVLCCGLSALNILIGNLVNDF